MNETIIPGETPVSSAPVASTEMVGVSEQLFNQSMVSMENLFVVQLIGMGIITGCVLALLIMRFFDVR